MSDGRFGGARATVTAGLAGFGCMAAELAAVRLQAPWFGDSAYVWTNVIGVILAALAAGAALGGMLANRPSAGAVLVWLCLGAGLLLALAPWLAPTLGPWLLPPELPLDAAMPAMIRGSLVATTALFAPPMVLLGAIGPLLVTLLVRGGKAVGSAAGAVSAAGTLGSLAGTFAATHWLVPLLGCRVTMVLAGALLGGAALLVARRRQLPAAAASLLLIGAGVTLHEGPLRPATAGRSLLAERETPYQLLQVVREHPADGPARTLLLINEGLDSFHSLQREGSSLTGAYYDWHAVAPLLAGDGARPAGLRALSIGDAAGSLRAVYAAVHPGAEVDGVDIDPTTMALGGQFFPGAKAGGQRYAMDGRVFVNLAADRWHVVHVDAYARQVYVPAHLASRQFFAAVRERLEPGGVVTCNVGALSPADPVLTAIGTTLAATFGHALALHVPQSRNFVLLARNGAPPDPAVLAGGVSVPTQLSPADAAAWRDILAICAEPRRWHDLAARGVLLTDDRPVLDELMMQSYVGSHRPGGQFTTGSGDEVPATAEMRAYSARQLEDWLGVLAATASSAEATPYLCELAGDAHWSLRQLPAAEAEYRAARFAAADDATRQRLDDNLTQLGDDLAAARRATALADRNGWLAWGCAALGAALAGLLYRMSRMPAAPSVSVLVAAR